MKKSEEILMLVLFFFFKQKTAYEMCGRDWSSDVCSSDLMKDIHVEGIIGYMLVSHQARLFLICVILRLISPDSEAQIAHIFTLEPIILATVTLE